MSANNNLETSVKTTDDKKEDSTVLITTKLSKDEIQIKDAFDLLNKSEDQEEEKQVDNIETAVVSTNNDATVNDSPADIMNHSDVPTFSKWLRGDSSDSDSWDEERSDTECSHTDTDDWMEWVDPSYVRPKDEEEATNKPSNEQTVIETKGEMALEDLHISVEAKECVLIGHVFQIVNEIVVVQSVKNTPVIDLDSVLFFEGGQPLGRIDDVMGQVSEPFYCVRLKSKQEVVDKHIEHGQCIYVAPKTEHTRYVFVSQLLKMKGSDASWTDNNEPPDNCLDYSDDEKERSAKKSHRKSVIKVEDPDEPLRKRHNAYEKRMNEQNLRMSASINPKTIGRGRCVKRTGQIIWPSSFASPGPEFSSQNQNRPVNPVSEAFSPPQMNLSFPDPNQYSFNSFPNPTYAQHTPNNFPFVNTNQPPLPPPNSQYGSYLPPFYAIQHMSQPSPIRHQFGSAPFHSLPNPPPNNTMMNLYANPRMPQSAHTFGNPNVGPQFRPFSTQHLRPNTSVITNTMFPNSEPFQPQNQIQTNQNQPNPNQFWSQATANPNHRSTFHH
uniref:H/ACA ribonucleoprotein complex non-core subunit NAF1 n=1 Tax=Clastoptera arizonana TaxID=38151 RepID=A0A1B6DT08_9HEMI